MTIRVRKGQAPPPLERGEFGVRFRNAFVDPAFRAEDDAIARLAEIAWQTYHEERKSPLTRKAGRGYADPAYALSPDWLETRARRWVAAHGVVIVTPVHWYQSPSALKLMVDRLVCADGGNPDPTSTHGKRPAEAKALEPAGWSYPKHLAKRAYGLVVHGDVAGIEGSRRALADWLDWMGWLAPASRRSSTASSATTSPTPAATTRSTATRRCKKKRAMSPVPSPASARPCARAS
jgi:multimeric flavodoxin WrbA